MNVLIKQLNKQIRKGNALFAVRDLRYLIMNQRRNSEILFTGVFS